MSNYRISDGSEKTKAEVIALNPNVSLPKVWDADVLATLNIDVIFETPKPTPSGTYKMVVRDGIEQDAKDNWVEKWVEQDMFADNDDKTKAEQETEYQAILDADAAKSVRSRRDGLLADTDFYALSDVTMTDDMKTYRQALRDITGKSEFPNLSDSDWPTKP
jgi:hypothetical protein